MTLHVIPLYNDPTRPETDGDRMRATWRGWAEDDLSKHDAAVTEWWNTVALATSLLMAQTGSEDQRQRAADYMHDMASDVTGGERAKLLSALDEAHGDVTRHPCPITVLHKAATA